MTVRQIIFAPNPIFKQHATKVEKVDESTRALLDDLFDTIRHEQAVGAAGPMIGELKCVVAIDMREGETPTYSMINPVITHRSTETQEVEEASLCFPHISAKIVRPKEVTVEYLDENGDAKTLEAEGFLASVVQHEIDYLNGVVFLDHLSKMKRDMLMKKMQKHNKAHPPHVHGAHCSH